MLKNPGSGCTLLLLLLLASGRAEGQIPAAPGELGMGGAYMGVARGYEAIFLAPGNLALTDAPAWSVGFPQVAVGGTLLGIPLGDIADLADYQGLSTSRQDELLSLIPAGGTEGRYSLRAPVVAISVGGVGLGATYASSGQHAVSKDLAQLFLRGYEEGRTSYAVAGTQGERVTYWDFVAVYARRIGPVSLGAAAHYVRGGRLVKTRLFEPRIDVAAQNIEVDYVGVNARGGSGFAADFGIAYQPIPALTISGAVSNAFASMNWSEDRTYRSMTFTREEIETYTALSLLNQYRYSEAAVDPANPAPGVEETSVGLYDQAEFPPVARLGVAYAAAPGTHFAADFHRKFSDGELADPWDHRLSLGVRQKLSIFSFRAGYALGNDGGKLATGGFSIGSLDIGIAQYQLSEIDGEKASGWMVTAGLGIAVE